MAEMKEMLEELKDADLKTFDLINEISKISDGFELMENPNRRIMDHIIQGEVQRAIEARGWSYQLTAGQCPTGVSIFTNRTVGHFYKEGNSPASALLACYLAALKAGGGE